MLEVLMSSFRPALEILSKKWRLQRKAGDLESLMNVLN
jgi:hypothetical protein